jgi:hypothetical protein
MAWAKKLKALLADVAGEVESAYAEANAAAIQAAVRGLGPDRKDPEPGAGGKMVYNIAAVYIPDFVQASLAGEPKPYKNGYDLGNYRIGDPPPGGAIKTREKVDRSLPLPDGRGPEDIYFAAAELNGTGIRFYGDICLVLASQPGDSETVMLDRNSYDLVRSPLREQIAESVAAAGAIEAEAMKTKAAEIAGSWGEDLPTMAALKVLDERAHRTRRLTTGAISDGVLSDEDYLEVLRCQSFGTADLQEARFTAADAAQEALISDRWRIGSCPDYDSLLWQDRRRRAEEFLRCAHVPVRVITTTGRVK